MNYSLLLLVFFVVVPYIHGTISDWRLCADPECRGAVSSGVASVNYKSIEPMVLSFNAGDEVTIYSKEAGQNKELWGAEVRGKRGYIPKRLVREMRIFLRNPSHTVPTELIQPSVMQPPNVQSTFIPQQQQPLQQQPHQLPMQQGFPQENFRPYQQPSLPHVNPQHHNSNLLPNQPVPMQQTPQLTVPQQSVPSQPKPLQEPPMQAIQPVVTTEASTVTPTAETQASGDINDIGTKEPSPVSTNSASLGEPPVQQLKESVTIEDTEKDKKEIEVDSEDDEEGDETDENDANDQGEDETDDDDVNVVEKATDKPPLDLKASDSVTVADVDAIVKAPAVDPMIEIGDLHVANSSPIHVPHVHSLEESIDDSLIKNEQAAVADTPISNKSQFIEEGPGVVVDKLPVEENATFDSVRDVHEINHGRLDDIPGEDSNASQPESWVSPTESSVESIQTDNEVKETNSSIDDSLEHVNETKPDDVVPTQEVVVESTTSIPDVDSDSAILPMAEIQQPTGDHVEPAVLSSDSQQPQANLISSSTDGSLESQQSIELPAVETQTDVPELSTTKEDSEKVEAASLETPSSIVEETTEQPLPPTGDTESLPTEAGKSEESKGSGTEGSGGGFLDSALNWLGLSDTEEPLKTEQNEAEPTDPAHLLQQIASMDPTLKQEIEPSLKVDLPNRDVNGFCDTQDCAKLGNPTDVPKQDVHNAHEQEDQVHHGRKHDGHDHHHNHDDHGHIHDGNDHHHNHDGHVHHHHGNDGHDHHHHGHGDHDHHNHGHDDHGHGHGHGHSHIPGYIPGFGHHYKPPVPKPQVASPPVVTPPPIETPSPTEMPLPPPTEMPPAPSVETVSPPTTTMEVVPEPTQELQPDQATPPPVVEESNPLPPAASQYLNQVPPVLEQGPQEEVGHLPNQVPVQEPAAVPEYIPVEEIFRAEMEKNRLLQEQQQQEQNGESLFDWFALPLSTLIASFSQMETSEALPKASLYPALLVSVTTVIFLTLYYSVQNKSVEKMLKSRISLLDSQLYESQSANEESSNAQTKLSEYETSIAELRSQKEQAEAERVAMTKRLVNLEKERDALEKEVECATESATEANRMLEELLASQSENDQWQRSVEVLQQQLNRQQQTMENLNSSLCVKTAENETLGAEVEELRIETERYKVRIKTLQSDLENLKTSNRNYQQKMAQEGGELMKLKQDKEAWVTERRSLSNQINRHAKEIEEWRDKAEQLKKSMKAKENDLAKSLELLKQSGNDGPSVLQLTSLVQLESELAEANQNVERLMRQVDSHAEESRRFDAEKADFQQRLSELQATCEAATRDKREAETRLEVLTNYFKEKETQLQKELGTHEAKRAITEENVSESVKKILETEESLTLYKSQVETLTKEIEEQERSYKSRLATQEKRAHENWVAARQLERRLEESKQEAAQLRHRLTQVEKDKEALVLVAKENGTANGAADVDLIKPVIKRPLLAGMGNNEELTMMDHPPLLSPPIPPPPPGMELGLGVPPPPGMPFDSLFPPPHFIPPAPFMPPDAGMLPPMHLMPSIPPPPSGMLSDHHRPPPLGMIATGSFDVDYRRDMADPPPPRRYPSPPRRYPSPLGSERSVRSDRSDRMDRYDDPFRPVSPYGRHGGRPRSVGRSRDVSPERPRSYSPLPSPLYPPHTTVHSPQDWDDGRDYNRAPMMRPNNLRHPQSGPKTSSPLIQPMDNGDRHHRPQP
ncbi:transport and Golgi organization protein 1-like isoform X1 [Daphnia carinata]|uniref:transport and Golgi organization protein 1-like isoform X1 n=1 Tax=Daphnia carinata TaxID=120202 RepID=UPI002868FB54|nr:transport and Golgi organization protein 1-like isoform X1 [Daphnia carinata]